MKKDVILQVITYLFLAVFLFIHINQGNFEFLNYLVISLIVFWIVLYLYKKTKFPFIILAGFSLWLFLHMLGGVDINGMRVYAIVLINLIGEPYHLIRFDQVMHFYIYVVFAALLYHVIKHKTKKIDFTLAVIASLAAMGIGALNEVGEFFVFTVLPQTGVGNYVNNAVDLVANTLGAIVGVALAHYFARKKKQ